MNNKERGRFYFVAREMGKISLGLKKAIMVKNEGLEIRKMIQQAEMEKSKKPVQLGLFQEHKTKK